MNTAAPQTATTPAPRPKAKFVGDREASTYRWELYLTGNGYVFDGYSKNKGQDEKLDKQALFQDCVARILNSGYLDKTYQMLWFKREFMHKSQDTLLLEMYPTHFVVHGELQLDISTVKFLERIYTAKKTGQGLNYKEHLPPRASKRDQEAAHFKFSLERFPTPESLVAHCQQLCNTYPRIRVEAWWRAVKDIYEGQAIQPTEPQTHNYADSQQPAAAPPAPAPAPAPAKPAASNRQTPPMPPSRADEAPAPNLTDPDNQQVIRNAQQAIGNIQNKFNVNR
jgi:hypothetical protein